MILLNLRLYGLVKSLYEKKGVNFDIVKKIKVCQLDSYMRDNLCQLPASYTLGLYLSYFFQTRKSYFIFLVTALKIKAGPVGPVD